LGEAVVSEEVLFDDFAGVPWTDAFACAHKDKTFRFWFFDAIEL
jgi:hypothetical protein